MTAPASPAPAWSAARPPFPFPGIPGAPLVDGLRVKRYPFAGLRLVCTISGRSHAVSAHPASATKPASIPAAAVCRTCARMDCDGCMVALALLAEPRDDRDAPTGRPALGTPDHRPHTINHA